MSNVPCQHGWGKGCPKNYGIAEMLCVMVIVVSIADSSPRFLLLLPAALHGCLLTDAIGNFTKQSGQNGCAKVYHSCCEKWVVILPTSLVVRSFLSLSSMTVMMFVDVLVTDMWPSMVDSSNTDQSWWNLTMKQNRRVNKRRNEL